MRAFIAVTLLMVAPMTLPEVAILAAASKSAGKAPALYDPNPAHIWNRLYAALLVREDSQGGQYGAESLDPPLSLESEYLLTGPSHARALRVLDEFLQTHAENLIRDPLKRAMLQRICGRCLTGPCNRNQLGKGHITTTREGNCRLD
jgi:hypothetical protein